MDFSLAGDGPGRNSNQERSAYTAKDQEGNTIIPQHMDVSLLMLYGHMLYAGKSYAYANSMLTVSIIVKLLEANVNEPRLFPSCIIC